MEVERIRTRDALDNFLVRCQEAHPDLKFTAVVISKDDAPYLYDSLVPNNTLMGDEEKVKAIQEIDAMSALGPIKIQVN